MESTHQEDGRRIGELLRAPYQTIVRHVHQALVAAGYDDLRPAHLSLFQHIDHPPDGTQVTALAERAQLTKQSMSEVVRYLEERNYVQRIPDPSDGRARLVLLTPRGWAVHETAPVIVRQLEESWAERLGRENMEQLQWLLKELNAMLLNVEPFD